MYKTKAPELIYHHPLQLHKKKEKIYSNIKFTYNNDATRIFEPLL